MLGALQSVISAWILIVTSMWEIFLSLQGGKKNCMEKNKLPLTRFHFIKTFI